GGRDPGRSRSGQGDLRAQGRHGSSGGDSGFSLQRRQRDSAHRLPLALWTEPGRTAAPGHEQCESGWLAGTLTLDLGIRLYRAHCERNLQSDPGPGRVLLRGELHRLVSRRTRVEEARTRFAETLPSHRLSLGDVVPAAGIAGVLGGERSY